MSRCVRTSSRWFTLGASCYCIMYVCISAVGVGGEGSTDRTAELKGWSEIAGRRRRWGLKRTREHNNGKVKSSGALEAYGLLVGSLLLTAAQTEQFPGVHDGAAGRRPQTAVKYLCFVSHRLDPMTASVKRRGSRTRTECLERAYDELQFAWVSGHYPCPIISERRFYRSGGAAGMQRGGAILVRKTPHSQFVSLH